MIRFAKGMNAFGKDEFLWNWDDKRDGWIPSESVARGMGSGGRP